MASPSEVYLPDIGDFQEVEVIEVLVAPGDQITAEQSLITLESDKATMEIPSPIAGTVQSLRVKVGDKISEGALLALVDTDDGQEAPSPPEQQTDEPSSLPEQPNQESVTTSPTVAAEKASPKPPLETGLGAETEVVEVTLPHIGDFHDVEIIEVLVAVGEQVVAEQSVLTLESDKATMEIPAPFAGEIREVKVAVGDRINQGQPILSMAVRKAAGTIAQPVANEPEASIPAAETTEQAETPLARPAESIRAPGEKLRRTRPVIARPSDAPQGKAHASPAVRRFARELGVDLMQVVGTASKGRITKEDVQGFVKRALASERQVSTAPTPAAPELQLPSIPVVDFSKFGAIEETELGRIKQISGTHLHRSWLTVPHVTQFENADVTEIEAFRNEQQAQARERGGKLTFMPFLLQAIAACLRTYPQFNASLAGDGKRLVLKKYIHIGVAVDTPNGLVVPVIRDVDKMGLFELAGELGRLSQKARDGKLTPGDMQGGCISVSSLGGIGGTQFAPVVNTPEVAIIGVSRASMQPVWNGEAFVPRLIMPFSLSYDHRVIDGAEGARFVRHLAELLGDIRRLLL